MSITSALCFKCFCEDKREAVGIEHYMYPLDRPYVNLFFHRDCYFKVRGDIVHYITENQEKMYKYMEK